MGFKRTFTKTCLVLKKHSPKILAVVGTVSTVAGVILACKTANETAEEVNQARDEVKQIKESIESGAVEKKDGKKSMHAVMWRCFKKVGKRYILPAGLTIGGIISLLASGWILAEWLTGTTVAYRQLEDKYIRLQDGVRDKYGEEALYELEYGVYDKVLEDDSSEDENASTGLTEPNTGIVGDYKFVFDKNSSRHISDATICDSYIVNAEKIFNQKLHKNGVLFLWEVLRDMDIRITDTDMLKLALNACWVDDPTDPNRDCHVSLRAKRLPSKTSYNPVYILDPNWDTIATNKWDEICQALR